MERGNGPFRADWMGLSSGIVGYCLLELWCTYPGDSDLDCILESEVGSVNRMGEGGEGEMNKRGEKVYNERMGNGDRKEGMKKPKGR